MHQTLRNSTKTEAPILLRVTMNRSWPLGLTAEIMLSENLWPVCLTTGVWPMAAQVVLRMKSNRIPDSSAKKISALPRLACARIFGYSVLTHCSTNEGFCSNALARGRWQLSPNCAKVDPPKPSSTSRDTSSRSMCGSSL
jgi:hypothetical protein